MCATMNPKQYEGTHDTVCNFRCAKFSTKRCGFFSCLEILRKLVNQEILIARARSQ